MLNRRLQERSPRAKNKPPSGPIRRERQIVRVLSLLRALAQGSAVTVRGLAANFRTRPETIYRDLRVLQDVGFPIVGDELGRLSRPRLATSRVPEIRFSPDELSALLLAVAQTEAALPTAESLTSAEYKLKKLAESEPDSSQAGLEERFETWSCGSKDYLEHEGHIALLIEAILRHRRCWVEYRAPSRPAPKMYDFDPYSLLFVGGGLYAVGKVPRHTGTATLAIHRLLSVAHASTTFEVDGEFDLQKCRQDALGVSWQDPIDIVLLFRLDQAPYVRERLWHPSQELTDLPDGSVRLAFRAGGPFEIRRWILGWGDAVEVLSPLDLREQIQQIWRSAASVYTN